MERNGVVCKRIEQNKLWLSTNPDLNTVNVLHTLVIQRQPMQLSTTNIDEINIRIQDANTLTGTTYNRLSIQCSSYLAKV